MRSPKQPEREPHNSGTEPRRHSGKPVVCKTEPRSKQIEDGQQEASDADQQKQDALLRIHSAHGLLDAAGASLKDPANPEIGNEAGEENEVPGLNAHTC